MSYTRREFVFMSGLTLASAALAGCRPLREPQKGIIFSPAVTPTMKKELTDFLGNNTVSDTLQADALRYPEPIHLHIREYSIVAFYGIQRENRASINAFLYNDTDPVPDLESKSIPLRLYEKPLAGLLELRQDAQMLSLFRNLVAVHEVAHVMDWYERSANHPKRTGHSLDNRIEIKLLHKLTKDNSIQPAMAEKLLHFYETYY